MQSKNMKGNIKNFKTVGDRKLLDRQRLIALHYAQVAIDRDHLESEALARLEEKESHEF